MPYAPLRPWNCGLTSGLPNGYLIDMIDSTYVEAQVTLDRLTTAG